MFPNNIEFISSPIIQIPNPPELRNWYRKRIRHEERIKEGKPSKPPALPQQEQIFTREHFLKFANLYLKVGYVLGGFQELNAINFELVRESMFSDGDAKHTPDADEHEHDIYEDEEIELSDDEEEEVKEEEANEVSLLTRIVRWILSLFDCNKYKAE